MNPQMSQMHTDKNTNEQFYKYVTWEFIAGYTVIHHVGTKSESTEDTDSHRRTDCMLLEVQALVEERRYFNGAGLPGQVSFTHIFTHRFSLRAWYDA